jgi:hypothetical protein
MKIRASGELASLKFKGLRRKKNTSQVSIKSDQQPSTYVFKPVYPISISTLIINLLLVGSLAYYGVCSAIRRFNTLYFHPNIRLLRPVFAGRKGT